MPMAAGVLTPLVVEEEAAAWVGTRNSVGIERGGTDVRVMVENPFRGTLV
jgi:hypothetical protein